MFLPQHYLEEKYLQMHIKMGDDGKYNVTRYGTITFQKEHEAPLTLKNVMYVPMLKKNLVSVAMLENRDYDVIFSKGKGIPLTQSHGSSKEDRDLDEEYL